MRVAEFKIKPFEYLVVLHLILNKAVWSFGVKFASKYILGKKFTNQFSNLKSAPLNTTLYKVSFKTKHFEVFWPNLPQKCIYRRNVWKQLPNLESTPFNTPLNQVSIQTKHFEILGPHLPQKRYFKNLGNLRNLRKQLSNSVSFPLNTPFILSLIFNNKLWIILSCRIKFNQKKIF